MENYQTHDERIMLVAGKIENSIQRTLGLDVKNQKWVVLCSIVRLLVR
jgi:hypothetical protein